MSLPSAKMCPGVAFTAEDVLPCQAAQVVEPIAKAKDALQKIQGCIRRFHAKEKQEEVKKGKEEEEEKELSKEDTDLFAFVVNFFPEEGVSVRPLGDWWNVHDPSSQPCQSGQPMVSMEYFALKNSFAAQVALATAFEGAKKYGVPKRVFVVLVKRDKESGLFSPVSPTVEMEKEGKASEGTAVVFNDQADRVFAVAMMEALNQKNLSPEKIQEINGQFKRTMDKVGVRTVINPRTIKNPEWREAAVNLYNNGDEDFVRLNNLAMSNRQNFDGVGDRGWFTVHQGLVPFSWFRNNAIRPEGKGVTWFEFSRAECNLARKDATFTYCPGFNPFIRKEGEEEEGEEEKEEEEEEDEEDEEEERPLKRTRVSIC
mmetsp:Transcript_4047/g.6265  ORF Transcript_4047/g.6265 Transcript_4047/m.6265 type:complete len:371 (-) Transcript_4047:5067-6179(-)